MSKWITAFCNSCNAERLLFQSIGVENKVNGERYYICTECQWVASHSRLFPADAAKHEQLIDLAGERIATLTQALTKIRDLAKAGRLDEIFTLANRALAQNPQQS